MTNNHEWRKVSVHIPTELHDQLHHLAQHHNIDPPTITRYCLAVGVRLASAVTGPLELGDLSEGQTDDRQG